MKLVIKVIIILDYNIGIVKKMVSLDLVRSDTVGILVFFFVQDCGLIVWGMGSESKIYVGLSLKILLLT